MATFMDIINQGLGGLNTPLGQLGTQLMLSSGPQPGNPSGGARLGQAFVGMQEQQARQQQLEMQNQLRMIQQQEMALRARGLQRQERKDATMEAVMQDPNFMSRLSPQQQMAVQMGTPMADVMKIGMSKQPTPPGMWDMPDPSNPGQFIRNVVNPQTGQLEQSVPFSPPQARTAAVAENRLAMDQQMQPVNMAAKQASADAQTSNAQATQQRVALEQQQAQRAADKATIEGKFKRLEFKQAYRGAVAQFDESLNLAKEIAESKALPNLYGPNGYIPPVAGTDAADLQAKIDRLTALGGLTELQKLKQNGIVLTPVSNNDMTVAQTSAFNPSKLQSDVEARKVFGNYAATMQKAKDEAATRYNEYDSLYDDKPASGPYQPQNAPTVPAVGTVIDGYRYNGGDPASPQSWSKQ